LMDCFIGASTGAFKVVDLKNSKFHNVNPIEKLKPKEHGIASMCFVDETQTEILVAQKNGQINVFSTVQEAYTPLFEASYEGRSEMKSIQMSKNGTIVTADQSGHVRLWTADGECSSSKIEAGNNLQCLEIDPLEIGVAATGGRENQLKLWDLEKGEALFTAKNVRDTGLSLRVPVWITNVCFVNDSKQICTTTGYHQIRLYDPKAQRKPVQDFKWADNPITALSTCHRDGHIIAGDNRGNLALFDLRSKIRPIQKYRGFAGSIRSIYAHPTEPFMASCGVDRFLLVHNIENRRTLNKIYCKTRLNSVVLRSESSLTAKKKSSDDEDEDDEMEPEAVAEFFKD